MNSIDHHTTKAEKSRAIVAGETKCAKDIKVYCEVDPKENTVRIFRGPKNKIGFVTESKESGEPYISLRGDETNGITHLTLGELDIILDNWNMCQELRREGVEA